MPDESSTPQETPGPSPDAPTASPAAASQPEPVVTMAAAPAAASATAPKPGPKSGGYFWGTGRRKTAVARVRIKPGEGKFLINKREIDAHFFAMRDRIDIVEPLKATKLFGKFDVWVNVGGGGQTGQAGAVSLGLARALLQSDPTLQETLRGGKFLTRDDRKVERKKPGQPGARKRFQFSKR